MDELAVGGGSVEEGAARRCAIGLVRERPLEGDRRRSGDLPCCERDAGGQLLALFERRHPFVGLRLDLLVSQTVRDVNRQVAKLVADLRDGQARRGAQMLKAAA